MKLVPFLLKEKKEKDNELTMYKLTIFLRHAGKAIWKTEESGLLTKSELIKEYLEPNEIYSNKIIIDSVNNIAFIEIDEAKLKFNEFYSWEESMALASKPECWRSFYFFIDIYGKQWWTPNALSCEADIQDYGNIAELFEDVLRKFR